MGFFIKFPLCVLGQKIIRGTLSLAYVPFPLSESFLHVHGAAEARLLVPVWLCAPDRKADGFLVPTKEYST